MSATTSPFAFAPTLPLPCNRTETLLACMSRGATTRPSRRPGERGHFFLPMNCSFAASAAAWLYVVTPVATRARQFCSNQSLDLHPIKPGLRSRERLEDVVRTKKSSNMRWQVGPVRQISRSLDRVLHGIQPVDLEIQFATCRAGEAQDLAGAGGNIE